VRVHHYECLYCRNRWTWQEGKPVATYNRRRAIAQDYEEVFGHPPTNED
jgi:pyruvate-formate lyase-activating enzyme